MSVVTPVDQVDEYFHDGLFLLRPALGDQQGQRNLCVAGQSFAAVGPGEDVVAAEESDEQGGGNALVAVAEGVVLDDEVEEVYPLLLHTRVELLAGRGLADGHEGALETLVFSHPE